MFIGSRRICHLNPLTGSRSQINPLYIRPESIPESRRETPRRVPLGGPMVERAPEVSTWEPSPASIPAPEAALEAAPGFLRRYQAAAADGDR